MSNTVVSYIRTYVPVAVGVVATYLAQRFHFVIDESTSMALVTGLTGVVTAVYYAAARWLEARWPAFGWLLGVASTPSYDQG